MPFTDVGRSGTAILWLGSTVIPNFVQIGSGSGTKNASTTALAAPTDMASFTSASGTSARFVEFVADFSSVDVSGLTLREFGVITSGATPALWSVEHVTDLTLDGTTELQFQVTWETF